jgi:hypothetical protein
LSCLGKRCLFILNSEANSSIRDNFHPHSTAVGHFNNDDLLDIVVANSGTNEIGVFLRYDNSTFANQTTYPTDLYSIPYAVTVGDFNNDQQLNIAVAIYGSNSVQRKKLVIQDDSSQDMFAIY